MPLSLLRPVSAAFADVASPVGGAEEPTVRTVFVLFAALTLLLLLFLTGVAVLAWSRKSRRDRAARRSSAETAPDEAGRDAWAEAGRRARAYPSRPPEQ